MAGFFRRLISRVFPRRVSETFEVEAVRPEALAYNLRSIVSIGGRQVSTPDVDSRGRLVVDGTTYKLDDASRSTRSKLRARIGGGGSTVEQVFSGLEGEERLRTFLSASPEIRVLRRARELLDRPDAQVRVSADFEPVSGETVLELKLGDEPWEIPDREIRPVLSHGGKWYSVTPSQKGLLERLIALHPRVEGNGRYRLDVSATPEILPLLRSRDEVRVSEGAASVRISDEPPVPAVDLEEDDRSSLIVRPMFALPESGSLVEAGDVLSAGEKWKRSGTQFFPSPQLDDPAFVRLLEAGHRRVAVPEDAIPDFLAGSPVGPGPTVERRWTGPAFEVDPRPARAFISAEMESNGELSRTGWIETAQGEPLGSLEGLDAGTAWIRKERRFSRAPEATELQAARNESGTLHTTDEIADYLIGRESTKERKSRIRLGPRAQGSQIDPTPATSINARLEIDEEARSIRARVSYSGNAATVSHHDLRSLPTSQRFYRNGDVFQAIDRRAAARVARVAGALGGEETREGYSFPAYLYDEVVSRFSSLGLIEQGAMFTKWVERLTNFERIEPVPLPQALKPNWQPGIDGSKPSGIRPYQQKGYDWLCFLKRYGFGGVLADEMGLGKTVQVLMAVARQKEQFGRWCSLVVTAKSAMGHWEKDARQFLDGLAIRRWPEIQRSVAAAKPSSVEQGYDIVTINYERVRSDIDYLAKLRFRFVILDEAQRTKNPESQTHKAVHRLRAESKLSVTATPVETRLRDMWSLFDIMMKGKLGSEREFVRRYEPRQRIDELSRKVRPFVLVRKKSMPEIELQLPGKSYRDRDCEMTPEQRRSYESIRSRERSYVVETTRTKPHGDAHIFGVLIRLQQICLHPALAGGGSIEPQRSGKAEATLSLLEELLEDENNRVLVFSRFVEAIKLLIQWSEPILSKAGAGAFTLIGATGAQERQLMIDQFNNRSSRERVMFVSLRAGGVGVNLQGANHVIHFDRWWNPAVEWQAEDRAYRMNSERPVTVHRITTIDSIEERVAAVLESRSALVRDVMDPQAAVEKLVTREELLRIFGVTNVN